MSEDVVILTALDVEYQAVRDRLTALRTYRHEKGTRFELGRAKEGRCGVALGLGRQRQ